MGIFLAKDLIESTLENKVTLVDIKLENLKKAKDLIKSDRLLIQEFNIENEQKRKELFKNKQVAICALLHKYSLIALEEAVRSGTHYVDLVGEFPISRRKYDSIAKEKDIILLSGMGASPGITNICAGRATYLLDEIEKILIFAGGNPVHPQAPLNYKIVYSIESLLNLYDRKARIIKSGEIREVDTLSGLELISFPPEFSEMECFYTDGLNSLIHTMRGKVNDELSAKTIRHKGHSAAIKILKSCGLFSKEIIFINGQSIIPRRVIEILLNNKMVLDNDQDVTMLRVSITGKKSSIYEKHIFEMIDYFDPIQNCTSMARATSFPASIASQMIAGEKISVRGTLFPEEVFHTNLFEPFMAELNHRGVTINHSISTKNLALSQSDGKH